MNRREILGLGLASMSSAALTPYSALAQAKYPERPIKLVVPFSAGGVNDVVGRQWADRMKGPLGAVYVENMGGAGGAIGALDIVRSAPDGHSLFLGSTSTMVLNPMTMAKITYNPATFEPIYILCVSIVSVTVHPSVPAKTLKEFIAYARANAGKLSYGSAGTGSMSHLGGELFKQVAGIKDMVHVPYKGAGPGITDLVSGHIQAMSPNVTSHLIALHQAGKVRILSVHSEQRLSALPDVPTSIEQGLPDMIAQLFLGIFAPPKTPRPIVDRVAEATRSALKDDSYRKALIASGFEPILDSGPEHARRYMAAEAKRWAPVVEAAGLRKGK